jgi:hypothetical protein
VPVLLLDQVPPPVPGPVPPPLLDPLLDPVHLQVLAPVHPPV